MDLLRGWLAENAELFVGLLLAPIAIAFFVAAARELLAAIGERRRRELVARAHRTMRQAKLRARPAHRRRFAGLR